MAFKRIKREYVLGIDLGTSYFKFGLFDKKIKLKGFSKISLQNAVEQGKNELSTEKFIHLIQEGIDKACQQAQASSLDIASIGYSSQANTFTLFDRRMKALTNFIIWNDNRGNDFVSLIKAIWQESEFLYTTGFGGSPNGQLMQSKIAQIQKKRSEVWNKTHFILTLPDYLGYLMTSKRISETGSLSLTAMVDIHQSVWWEKAIKNLNIDIEMLSQLCQPGESHYQTSSNANHYFSIREGIPFVSGSLDHYCAAIGSGTGKIADASESTGTVVASTNFTSTYEPSLGKFIAPGFKKNTFVQIVWDENGAIGIEWYQRNFAPEYDIKQLDQLAVKVSDDCDGLIAMPMAWKYPQKQGFLDVFDCHRHGHFIRALMVSTAHTLKDLIEKIDVNSSIKCIAATGGGSKSDLWLDIKSKILNLQFIRTNSYEPGCAGAGALAAKQIGWIRNIEEFPVKIIKVFKPV